MSVTVLRGDARDLPLPDASVDLIVTSPPYFGLRSYTDGGEHYAGQIGSEGTPAEWVAALVACTAEWVRVLKPSGSLFVNLGDSYYSGKGAPGKTTTDPKNAGRNARRTHHSPLDYGLDSPRKTLLGLPWRYALACTDQLGLILRAEIIWAKPNGLPESVTDRVRRAHEQVFHFTRQPRYYSAVDEIRETYTPRSVEQAGIDARAGLTRGTVGRKDVGGVERMRSAAILNPLGKLPGSVWNIPSQPLTVPASLGVDHFAAFPMELPRRCVLGWSPPGVCVACGEGRRPLRGRSCEACGALVEANTKTCLQCGHRRGAEWQADRVAELAWRTDAGKPGLHSPRRVKPTMVSGLSGGYACACPDTSAPTRPALVVDPFGGTGTTALVAAAYGRHGITVDMSADYCRVARWRTRDPGQMSAALQVPKPPPVPDGQGDLFSEVSS